MADRPVKAVFLGDASQLVREARKVQDSLKGVDASLEQTGGRLERINQRWGQQIKVATAVGTAAVVGFSAASVRAAANLEQSIGGVESVFKENADTILAWGNQAADSAGLSRNAFNQLAAPLGAMLKNSGFAMDEVAEKTIALTQRAADMAATFGTPVAEAVTAISAALRGETDPIERFGVSLRAVDVQARALADTGKKAAADLKPMELQAARLALIFEQTADAAGQFAREADTVSGKTERLRARFENLQADFGTKLIPVINALLEVVMKVPTELLVVVGALTVLATAFGAVLVVLPMVAAGFTMVTGSAITLGGALGLLGTVALPALIIALPVAALAWWKYNNAQKAAEQQSVLNAQAMELVTDRTYAEIEAQSIAFNAHVRLLEAEKAALEESIRAQGVHSRASYEMKEQLDGVTRALGKAEAGANIWNLALDQSKKLQDAAADASANLGGGLDDIAAKAANAASEMRKLSGEALAASIAMDAYAADTPEAADAQWQSAIQRVRVRLMEMNFQRGVIDNLLNHADPTGTWRGGSPSIGGRTSSGGGGGGGSSSGGGGALNAVDVIFKNSQARRFAGGEFLGLDTGTPGITLRGKQDDRGGLRDVTIVVNGSIHSDRDLRDFIIEALEDYNTRTAN